MEEQIENPAIIPLDWQDKWRNAHMLLWDRLLDCTRQLRYTKSQEEQTFWHNLWVGLTVADGICEEETFPTEVSWSKIRDANGKEHEVGIGIKRASGLKCKRCWVYKLEVGSNYYWPDICIRCADACQGLFDSGILPGETWSTSLVEKGKRV